MLSLIIAFFPLQAVQSAHMAEELVTESHWQMKEKESRRITVVEAFSLIEKRIQELNNQLTEADRERKSVEAALHGAKRQVETQRKQFR